MSGAAGFDVATRGSERLLRVLTHRFELPVADLVRLVRDAIALPPSPIEVIEQPAFASWEEAFGLGYQHQMTAAA
ncbi:MAG TPA: hypothetical protein VF351_08735 [Actinomycetota bacterium]